MEDPLDMSVGSNLGLKVLKTLLKQGTDSVVPDKRCQS